MSRKTEVMRLTAEEANLVGVLRGLGVSNALDCIDSAISSMPVDSSEFLRSARSALKPTVFMSLDGLVSSGAISKEDVDYLREALLGNKSIAITGTEGSGKTTFLKALLGAMDVKQRVYVLENHEDLEISKFASDKNILSLKLGNLSARDIIGRVLHTTPDKLFFGEILTSEDVSSLTVSLMCGHSVIFSSFARTEDSVVDVLANLCGDGSPRIIEALKSSEFIVVRCERSEDGSRSFIVQK